MLKQVFVIFLFILFLGFVSAEPVKVSVGSYILNVGNYEPAYGSYDAKFYLWFRWNPDMKDFSPENFEFMNGKEVSVELVEQKQGYLFYRGEGSFFKKLDMSNFPFDSHEISIELEDELLTTDELVYVPDSVEKSSLNPDIAVLGWKTKSPAVEITAVYYETWDQVYSRYIHKITVSRPFVDSLKVFLPIFFLSLLGFFTFLVSIRKFSERLSLSVFTFMAAVAYQIQVNVTIPPLGFFTFADKAMLAVYAGLLFASFYTIYIEWFEEHRHKKIAKRTNQFAISAYFVLQLFIFFGVAALDLLF